MNKGNKSLLEMLMTEDQDTSERSSEAWNKDPYSPERLDKLLKARSRSEMIGFLRTYVSYVKHGRIIPAHWLGFIATLFTRAIDTVNSDPRARDNPLARVMGLSGREDHRVRDELIAQQVRRLYRQGGNLDEAIDTVQAQLTEKSISLSRNRVTDIYNRRVKHFDDLVETTLQNGAVNFVDEINM